ncbi:MAG: hypothetical protein HC824_05870 [Synechococcales cyanobacterium RM1_1_8]|nr:hypothetical protein [Synechococcales cyanobacterium RM1_1_8]
MAYSDFTQAKLEASFGLSFSQTSSLIAGVEAIATSDYLQQTMQRNLPLATAINTEKIRSELLIAPILVELKTLFPSISFFSGTEFNVDAAQGLNGYCDFLISRDPDQLNIKAPVAIIFEAKREDLNAAIPQCAAAMVAAQRFNQNHGIERGSIYGAVTTGSVWRFLKLEGEHVTLDLNEVYLNPLGQLMGSLVVLLQLEPLAIA